MSHLPEFWSFRLPNFLFQARVPRRTLCRVVFPLLLASLLLIPCNCRGVQARKDAEPFKPQVLVLVLGGLGPSDMCSINYDGVVALPRAQSDLDAMAAAGKWQVRDAKGETKSSGGPKPVPTTSISFMSKGLIDYANGTLPLEPYLIGLRRFKHVEVGFIAPAGFAFRGLKDFENDLVKIELRQSGNSYKYRVTIKDHKFETLDLPLREPAKRKDMESTGSGGSHIVLALVIAVLAAVVVYLVMTYLAKRR